MHLLRLQFDQWIAKRWGPVRQSGRKKRSWQMHTAQRRRVGVVGCGKVASTHASAWRRLAASELVGVCDRNLDRAKALAARFGVRGYGDLAEMIETERLEILSVCTQHTQRAPLIETAAAPRNSCM